MQDAETAAVVALLRLDGSPPAHVYAELIEEAGSARTLLGRRDQAGFAPASAEQIQLPLEQLDPSTLLEQARDDLDRWQRSGIRALTVLDPEYPDNLRAVHDRPPLIFLRGSLTQADVRSVAVIGARRASPAGRARAAEIAAHLAARGYTVVSGLALGIDTAAHEGALAAANGRSIAVIGTGLNHAYPPQNARLQARMASEAAVVSQFWPDQPPSRTTFPLRNATMSGLSLATVIVEAGQASGARIQARRALGQGRRIFLCRPVLAQAWARQLKDRPGVQVVDEPAEISGVLDDLLEHTSERTS